MLTVWSLCWGDKYPDYYVQRLKESVSDYVTLKHRFVCITDRDIDGVDCIPPVVDWPGWWGKIQLFKPGFAGRQNLFLDLDVVITGNLDNMILQYAGSALAAPNNWAASGWGGVQSSVMLWHSGGPSPIYSAFDPAIAYWPPRNEPGVLWGDQEFITTQRTAGFPVTQIDPALVQSYKYHCRDKPPSDECKIVVFHGDPKPSEVKNAGWFKW
jgi:hypothetical protein